MRISSSQGEFGKTNTRFPKKRAFQNSIRPQKWRYAHDRFLALASNCKFCEYIAGFFEEVSGLFSHVAEETARLSHAFIGALFSVILVFSVENMLAIVLLSVALFSLFVLNSVALHFFLKATFESKSKYIVLTVVWFCSEVVAFIALSASYTLKSMSPNWLHLTEAARLQIGAGLAVFFVFMLVVNVTHIHSCARHREGLKLV